MYSDNVTQVGGDYTALWIVTNPTKKHEAANLWEGDECELDHDHSASKSCDEQYKCDDCGDVHNYESDAESCCEKHECNFCGWVHSASYWGTTSYEAARACCVTSCDDCGDDGNPDWMQGHNCDNGKGMRRALPWEQRGVKVDARDPDEGSEWKQAWNLEPENHNVVRAAADYYLLEAMKAGLVGTINAEVETGISAETGLPYTIVTPNNAVANHSIVSILRDEATEMFNALVEKWDPILIAYTHMAVGGELRHHNAVGGEVLHSDRNVAWSGWKLIFESVGPDALTDAAELFHEFSGGSFGGKPWADACLILHKRVTEQISRAMFLDRIFNAQHNGGCLLNKVQWAGDKARYASNYGGTTVKGDIMTVEEMTHKVLPAHGATPEPDYSTLLAYASGPVQQLFADFHEYGRRARLDMGMTLSGLPPRPQIGRTQYQQREYDQQQYQAKQAALAAMPKSEKLKASLRSTIKQLKVYETYAENEAVTNARVQAKIEAGKTTCDCGYGCSWDNHLSHYYTDMVKYYQQSITDTEAAIAKALVKEAEAELAKAASPPASNPPLSTWAWDDEPTYDDSDIYGCDDCGYCTCGCGACEC